VFHFSDSRTGFACGCVLVLLLLVYKYATPVVRTSVWKVGVVLGVFAMLVFGVVSVVYYGKIEFFDTINGFLTGRLLWVNQAYSNLGISWFGHADVNAYVLDNGYMYMLLGFGVIIFTVYWICLLSLMIRALKKGQNPVVVLIIVFSLYAIMEGDVMIKIFRNVPMIYFADMMFGERK